MGELRVLGAVEAWAGERRVELGHARQQCVLVVLAVDANRVVSADQLLERAWGDRLPSRGRATLHAYLSRLRRALSDVPDVQIVHRSGGWALQADPDAVDLHRFHRLLARARTAAEPVTEVEQALGLWRGDAFTGLDTPWICAVRETLEQERRAAELTHTDLALDAGRHAELLPVLAIRVRENPLEERMAGQYLVALYRSGRQADALAHYQAVRQRLAEELGAVPGADLQALHRRILAADGTLHAIGGRASAPADEHPVPRQLPPAPPRFTGRVAELAGLSSALDSAVGESATVVISALSGAGGIGKTWLALHWAHRNLDRFPAGQLFVDLRGFSPDGQPMSTGAAVRGFLDALGVDPAQLPVDPHAQAARYRSLVAGRPMLIVLDNAAHTGQITPLLPGSASCTVLVTSRQHLTGLVAAHGAHHLPIDVLTEPDARALLTARLGAERVAAEPAAVADLLACCGGFPLALSIVAGRAQIHARLPLATLAAELHDAGLGALDEDDDPAASLPAVLSWSYRALTDQQAGVFGLLGLAPGPDLGLSAAASLTGLPVAEARAALRGLAQVSLLDQDASGRYRMHDLIRQYAGDTARRDQPEADRAAAVRRVVDFYLHTAHHSERLLDPHRTPIEVEPPAPGCRPDPPADSAAAMAWFEAEHAGLLAAQQAAVAQGLHRSAWQLAWTLDTFHRRRGHLYDLLAAWQTGLAAAEHVAEATIQAQANRNLGHAYALVGRYDDALRHLHQSITLAEHADDHSEQAHSHRALAWAWERQGDDRKALDHATHALRLARAVGNPTQEAAALNEVGWYAARLGEYDQARVHCEAALTLFQRHDNRNGAANTLDSLGYIAHRTARQVDAIDQYQQSLALRRRLGHTYQAANSLEGIGHPYAALGRHREARTAWLEALDLYQSQRRVADAERVQEQLAALERHPTEHTGSA
ncbi:BTAD domain-containing putative transcriptional regulator [Actinosynnema sp. CS-041913]|uniref:AfsR/SARP family transcriptional regulator n=1 Tax=Actinosynnema sp. CS-041913 TaxID=3239917 RepID=UPI003D948326